jgi:KaiC/GvpD/RAD55 family RecA-like ATPase
MGYGQPLTEEERASLENEVAALEREIGQAKPIMKARSKVDLCEVLEVHEPNPDIESPIFFSPMQIKPVKRDSSQVVPSGIDLLDRRIIGFNFSELSVWSGSNGSGKSSVLSQLTIESISNGFKVALFSGELREDRVLNWLQIQACGKKHSQSTKYENYYTVPDGIKSKVNKWLEGKLYIYNNQKGTKVEEVLLALDKCITEHGIKVVVIDNLMSLDLTSVNGEKWDRQTNLVIALSQLAKKRNVVIHFVAHPRKSIGFLRKTDISGTADITNLADNVFIVHRVNTDFKRSIKEYLGVKDGNPIMSYDNVIEICKNRDLGVSDEFVGLYFEKESKSFLNTQKETKCYGWEEDERGFIKVDDREELPFAD